MSGRANHARRFACSGHRTRAVQRSPRKIQAYQREKAACSCLARSCKNNHHYARPAPRAAPPSWNPCPVTQKKNGEPSFSGLGLAGSVVRKTDHFPPVVGRRRMLRRAASVASVCGAASTLLYGKGLRGFQTASTKGRKNSKL